MILEEFLNTSLSCLFGSMAFCGLFWYHWYFGPFESVVIVYQFGFDFCVIKFNFIKGAVVLCRLGAL